MMSDEDKAMIARLIDGSLDGDPREREIRDLVERDPEAQAYAAQVMRNNMLLRRAFDAPMREPMPAGIRATLFGEPGKVAMLRRPRAWVPTALAAGMALAVGLGAALTLMDEGAGPQIARLGDAPVGGPLHRALETLPSGSLSDAGVQPMLTFLDGDGRACREFEVIGELPDELELGIACRGAGEEAAWHVEVVVAAPIADATPEGDGFAPASGGPAETALDAMLDALDAGPTLTPDAEARLLRDGWTTR